MANSTEPVKQLHEAARTALNRAHEAALSASGAELRRSLTEARDALREAAGLATHPNATTAPADAPALAELSTVIDRLTLALADLDSGELAALEPLIEAARRDIGASGGGTDATDVG